MCVAETVFAGALQGVLECRRDFFLIYWAYIAIIECNSTLWSISRGPGLGKGFVVVDSVRGRIESFNPIPRAASRLIYW